MSKSLWYLRIAGVAFRKGDREGVYLAARQYREAFGCLSLDERVNTVEMAVCHRTISNLGTARA
jgi:hypothetical protein